MSKSVPSVTDLLNDPIKSGYLLAFCESEYNAENMRFILEIDKFRDFLAQDKSYFGRLHWEQIDTNIKIKSIEFANFKTFFICDESEWNSTIIPYENVKNEITNIWETYLSSNAENQICIPSNVLSNTKRRLELLHLYGPYVFDETLIDPIKTLKRDVLPRFLISSYYKELLNRISYIRVLPTIDEIIIPNPTNSDIISWEINEITAINLQNLDLSVYLNDYLLYSSLLSYFKSIVSSENLLCLRLIYYYKEIYDTIILIKEKQEIINNIAWNIYLYFIANNSVYEISLNYRYKKLIMLELANPSYNIFTILEKSLISLIKINLDNYYNSKYFNCLINDIINEIEIKNLHHLREIDNNKIKRRNTMSSLLTSYCLPISRKMKFPNPHRTTTY